MAPGLYPNPHPTGPTAPHRRNDARYAAQQRRGGPLHRRSGATRGKRVMCVDSNGYASRLKLPLLSFPGSISERGNHTRFRAYVMTFFSAVTTSWMFLSDMVG